MSQPLALMLDLVQAPSWYLSLTFHFIIIGYYTTVMQLLLVAFNRFCAVVYYKYYTRIFTWRVTMGMIALGWGFGLVVDIAIYTSGIHGIFDPSTIKWKYNGPDYSVYPYFDIDLKAHIFVVTLLILIYGSLITKLRKVKKMNLQRSNRSMKKEAQLALQFLVIVLFFVTAWLCYLTVYECLDITTDEMLSKWMVYMFNLSYTISYACNSYIHFLLNKTLRTRILLLTFSIKDDHGNHIQANNRLSNLSRSYHRPSSCQSGCIDTLQPALQTTTT